jgi:hypothetical protein
MRETAGHDDHDRSVGCAQRSVPTRCRAWGTRGKPSAGTKRAAYTKPRARGHGLLLLPSLRLTRGGRWGREHNSLQHFKGF